MRHTDQEIALGLREDGALVDEVYLKMDKLIALCAAQTALDFGDQELPRGIRSHYSLALEEQARALRQSLTKLLG